MNINLEVKNIRNIRTANLSFDFKKGVSVIVGDNASGKSTIMILLSLLIKQSSKFSIKSYNLTRDSEVIISTNNGKDYWKFRKTRAGVEVFDWSHSKPAKKTPLNKYKGYYEGSIFYGSRFDDYQLVEKYMETESFINGEDLRVKDKFVRDSMSFILHGVYGRYEGLHQIMTLSISRVHGFKGKPYFLKVNEGHMISQFDMSSGESMLLSLIDFINNYVVFGKPIDITDVFFIIDEVELALHPSAVDRLMSFLEDIIKTYADKFNIYAIFATHSTEVINRVNPNNIYMMENKDGILTAINPCYPNYAIRKLYIPNGYDFLILVEDEFAKSFVDKIIRDNNLSENKLKCTLPGGGYSQLLKLHSDIINYNIIGVGKKVISIYDGDVKDKVIRIKEYQHLPKLFLPIKSIEKFLLDVLVVNKDKQLTKILGDKYFTVVSIDKIIQSYEADERTQNNIKSNGKKFFKVILSHVHKIGISEREFIVMLCDDIFSYGPYLEEINNFTESLKNILD